MHALNPGDRLLAWYDRHGRDLPWRARGAGDPYRVWLSEVMLQQTTVPVVIPYYRRFLERWPTLAALAAADRDDVLALWAGLGYYARAARLHECALTIVRDHAGRFPGTVAELKGLPGIGAYTAGAIAAIAFDQPEAAVDGNVERVMARYLAVDEPAHRLRRTVAEAVSDMVPRHRPGDFAQALMDLGAMVCTPRAPRCGACPLEGECRARQLGLVDSLPRRSPRKRRPRRQAMAFWIESADGRVMLNRRSGQSLLGDMLEVPSTPWRDDVWTLEDALVHAPRAGNWSLLAGSVEHAFTHIAVTFRVARHQGSVPASGDNWHAREAFPVLALPAMTWKIIDHVDAARRETGENERR